MKSLIEMPEGAAPYLDCGFVKLIDTFGSDESIEAAARVSYSGGDTKRKVSDTRTLLRYLLRHHHTSPFEMAEVQFVLRIPIFVMRQLVRHRTANINEYSGRYSVMTSDCYVPDEDRMQEQSKSNKQGSGKALPKEVAADLREDMINLDAVQTSVYHDALDRGLAREVARCVLPVSNYTMLYWKCDLSNFFKMLKLRLDPHAQYEIRLLAELMMQQVRHRFPIAFEAFDDYILGSVTFSRAEIGTIRDLISRLPEGAAENTIKGAFGLSKREHAEFLAKLSITPQV